MATYSPLSSLCGPRDQLDRLVADILDDEDECPLENNYQEQESLKTNLSQKDVRNQEAKGSVVVLNSFSKNGRCSSGSSSNGDSRDSGFECGMSSGSVSTPSSSRRTTSSSDNFSTPTLSSASEVHSPSSSSEKISSDHNSLNVSLQISPLMKQDDRYNDQNAQSLIKDDIDTLLEASITKSACEDRANIGRFINLSETSSVLGLQVNFGSDPFDKTSNVAFSDGEVGFGSQASPNNRKNNEMSSKTHSNLENALVCPTNQSITALSLKSVGLQIGGLQVNSGSSIHSSSRSSPTSSLSGSSGTAGSGNIRIQMENFNHQGCDLQNDKTKLPVEGNGSTYPSSVNTNMPSQIPMQYQQNSINSPSDYYSHQPGNVNSLEKENAMDSQVAALQQAVALMQMGNMFESESKRNIEEKMNNSSPNIYQRNPTTDSAKDYLEEDRSVSSLSSQEPKQDAILENIFSLPAIMGSSSSQTVNQHSPMNNQLKAPENIQRSCLQPGVNQIPQANFGSQNNGKHQNDDGMLNSALLENLTALAKLDELTSQSNQPIMDMPNNLYQNVGAGGRGDGFFNRSHGQEQFHRTFINNGYQAENFPLNHRYNGQQRAYQQQITSNNHGSDQQSALLQLAAMAAASEHQHSPFAPSPRSMKSTNSPFSMQGASGFNTGMVERNRSMTVGGRGSPSINQYAMDPMTQAQDNMRLFRGDNVARYNGMYGASPNISNNGQLSNALRSMEQKNYPANPPLLSGAPFDMQAQATGGYINAGGNSIIPSSTTADLANAEGSQMQIRCKFGQLGQGRGQFNAPHGFCLGGRDEEIVVADTHNHRIQVFDKNGNFRYMFGSPGKEEGCLWYPRKVVVMKNTTGNFVVCDRGCERSRMQIFSPQGHFIRRIAIRFIDIVAGLAVQCWGDGHIVAVDSVTPTIFVLAEDGRLIKYHECSEFMNEPSDIAVFGRDYYICDFKGHSVVVVNEEGQFLRRIGSEKVTCFPNGIDISDAGDVLIGDSHGNQFHVAVYDKDAQLVSQFVCPNVKVSRCCGLKITMEGYIVTLAKNNHHVLVLNTLYVS